MVQHIAQKCTAPFEWHTFAENDLLLLNAYHTFALLYVNDFLSAVSSRALSGNLLNRQNKMGLTMRFLQLPG